MPGCTASARRCGSSSATSCPRTSCQVRRSSARFGISANTAAGTSCLWHRGDVLALEANIRAEVVALNGPADWALPYWNYFAPNEAAIPPAFAGPDWPDGVGNNPLFVEQRYGPNGDGDVFVPTNQVDLNALGDPDFTGVSSGGTPGSVGWTRASAQRPSVHGGIETQPHDWVHGLVGGRDAPPPAPAGAMADRGRRPSTRSSGCTTRTSQAVGGAGSAGPPASPRPVPADVAPGPGQRRRARVLRTDAGWHDVYVHPRRDDEPRGPRL